MRFELRNKETVPLNGIAGYPGKGISAVGGAFGCPKGIFAYRGAVFEYPNGIFDDPGEVFGYRSEVFEYRDAVFDYIGTVFDYPGPVFDYIGKVFDYLGEVPDCHDGVPGATGHSPYPIVLKRRVAALTRTLYSRSGRSAHLGRFAMPAKHARIAVSVLLALGITAAFVKGGPPASHLPLEVIADAPLPGGATRMDYIAIDPAGHRAFLAHMGDGSVISVDTNSRTVIAGRKGTPRVRGVLFVPDLGRVYAAAAGSGEVVVLDAGSLKALARVPAGNVDGLDYAPAARRLFVTGQHGGNDVVIDAETDKVLKKIPVGGDAGNTRFDPSTGRVLVAVGSSNELVAIDPESMEVTSRYPLPGVKGAHGITVAPSTKTAFIAGEDSGLARPEKGRYRKAWGPPWRIQSVIPPHDVAYL